MQERWFGQAGGGLSAAAVSTLKQLPIFHCGPSLPAAAPPNSNAPGPQQAAWLPGSHAPAAAAAAQDAADRHFTDLVSATRQLPPAGTAQALLTSAFVIPGSREEAEILSRHLGVPQLECFAFVAQHLLPHAAALPVGVMSNTRVYK